MKERTRPKRLRGWTALALLAPALGGLISCEPPEAGPRQTFAAMTTCPPDDATVLPRPDYRIPAPPPMPPPPEVAADPARLADWQRRDAMAKQRNDAAPCGAALPGFTAFEVRGCGQDVILCCARSPAPGGPAAGGASCVQQPMAGGGPPFHRGSPAPPAIAPPSAPTVEAPASSSGIAL